MSEWHFNHLGCSSQSVFPGTPALPLSSCVSSCLSLHLSEPQFLCLLSGGELEVFPSLGQSENNKKKNEIRLSLGTQVGAW